MAKAQTLIFITAVSIPFLISGGWLLLRGGSQPSEEVIKGTADTDYISERPSDNVIIGKVDTILHNVPFSPQAPSANWDNVIFQQGCEEASILMAMLWVEGKKFISPKDAEKAIIAMSSFEQKNYGEFRDTSSADTVRWAKDYFDYENIEAKNDINTEDIKAELVNGNLVIVAVNGQKLGNPFYTPPGPIQHMLVIRGYDASKKEFITNDPGTKRGEAFRYKEEILGGALQDYATGYKEPTVEARRVMIVVHGG